MTGFTPLNLEQPELPSGQTESELPAAPEEKLLPDGLQRKYTAEEIADIIEHRVFAAISYLYVLSFVVFLAKHKSKYARFHAKQGMALCALAMLFLLTPGFIAVPVELVLFSMMLIGCFQAMNGFYYRAPLIYNLTLNKDGDADVAFAHVKFTDILKDARKDMRKPTPEKPTTAAELAKARTHEMESQ